MKVIKLVRHGLSNANTGDEDVREIGDCNISLKEEGHKQGRRAGQKLGRRFVRKALHYRSPYRRTRQTSEAIIEGAGLTPSDIIIYEDPALREVEHGYQDVEAQEPMRAVHGWFYYRYNGGESPADCYDRCDRFFHSLHHQMKRKQNKKALIVSHGLTIRCLVMRFLHLTVEEFESIANPHNCDIITIAPKNKLKNPQFTRGRWGVTGLRFC
jgi:broad specificity phosphatase PhoE